MKTRLWMVCVGAVGAAALIATLRGASSQSVFLSKAVPVMSGAAVLGTEEYNPPDPNDPNDMTGIAGYLGAYDPNDPNQDPNDPLSVPPICEAVIHAMQDGEFVGSAMSGLLDSPDEGVYFIPRLDEDTYPGLFMVRVFFTASLWVKLRLLKHLTPNKEAAYVRTVC